MERSLATEQLAPKHSFAAPAVEQGRDRLRVVELLGAFARLLQRPFEQVGPEHFFDRVGLDDLRQWGARAQRCACPIARRRVDHLGGAGMAGKHALEVLDRCAGARVAFGRIDREHGLDDAIDVGGQSLNAAATQRHRGLKRAAAAVRHAGIVVPRQRTAQHLEQDDPQAVDVGEMCDCGRRRGMFGGKIAGRAHKFIHGRQADLAGLAGDPKVGQQHAIGALLEQNVAWRHVAVDDAVRVRIVERRASAAEHVQGQLQRQRSMPLEQFAKRAACHILHDGVVIGVLIAMVVDLDDMLMAQAAGDLRLAREPLDPLRVLRQQQLHCDLAVIQ